MSTKKSDKSEEKKDQSFNGQIKQIEANIKALSSNISKLKSLFKTKGGTAKKDQPSWWNGRINLYICIIFSGFCQKKFIELFLYNYYIKIKLIYLTSILN